MFIESQHIFFIPLTLTIFAAEFFGPGQEGKSGRPYQLISTPGQTLRIFLSHKIKNF